MNSLNQVEKRKEPENQSQYIAPRVDIIETKNGYTLEAEMPGVNKQGLELLLDNDELTIIGHREFPSCGDLIHRETTPRPFRRVFALDPAIDSAKITAQMDQGVLVLQLPKAERLKPRKIPVTE